MRKTLIALILIAALVACESTDVGFIEPKITPEEEPPPPPPAEGPFLEITVPRDTSPNAALGPPIHTFHWKTINNDGADAPDSVRWAYFPTWRFPDDWDGAMDYITENADAPEWYPWQTYEPDAETGTMSWTTPPLDRGPWLFVLHGKMRGGTAIQEFDFARNARRVLVTESRFYAELTGDFIDTTRSSHTRTPVIILNLPVGTPVEFCWTGRQLDDFPPHVLSYRYGWDVIDIREESEWEVWYTEFDGSERCSTTRTFDEISTHTFLLDVLSHYGFTARFTVTINFIQEEATRSLGPSFDQGGE